MTGRSAWTAAAGPECDQHTGLRSDGSGAGGEGGLSGEGRPSHLHPWTQAGSCSAKAEHREQENKRKGTPRGYPQPSDTATPPHHCL